MRYLTRISLFLALLLLCAACGSKPKQLTDDGTHEIVAEVADNVAEELIAELTEGATSEVLVDFGVVEPRSVATRNIRVVNHTDAPIVLLDYDTTCRCTTLELDRTPIAPGGEVMVVLSFDSRGEWGSVGNFLDIATSNPECGFVIWMGATVE